MPYFSQNVKSDMMRHSEVVFRINRRIRRYFYGSAQAKIKINVFISDDLHNGHNCKAIAAISSLISIFNFPLFSSPSSRAGCGGKTFCHTSNNYCFITTFLWLGKKWLHENCIYNEIPLEQKGKLKKTHRGAASIHLTYAESESAPTPDLMEVCRLDRSEQTN